MKRSNKITKEAILATLRDGIEEAKLIATHRLTPSGYVVCFEYDSLPMRKNDKGEIGAMVGGKVWVSLASHTATGAAAKMNTQAQQNGAGKIIVLPDTIWAERRIAQLEQIIANVTEKM